MLQKQKELNKKQNINMLQGYFKFGIILNLFFLREGFIAQI